MASLPGGGMETLMANTQRSRMEGALTGSKKKLTQVYAMLFVHENHYDLLIAEFQNFGFTGYLVLSS